MEEISLKASNISYFSDLTMSESLQHCRKLVRMDVSSNPHGEDGVRALLRLLMRKECGLSSCNISRCRDRYYAKGENFRYQFHDYHKKFDVLPDQNAFNLENPAHRAGLKLAYERAEFFQVSENDAFSEMQLDGGKCPAFPLSLDVSTVNEQIEHDLGDEGTEIEDIKIPIREYSLDKNDAVVKALKNGGGIFSCMFYIDPESITLPADYLMDDNSGDRIATPTKKTA